MVRRLKFNEEHIWIAGSDFDGERPCDDGKDGDGGEPSDRMWIRVKASSLPPIPHIPSGNTLHHRGILSLVPTRVCMQLKDRVIFPQGRRSAPLPASITAFLHA